VKKTKISNIQDIYWCSVDICEFKFMPSRGKNGIWHEYKKTCAFWK